MNPQVRQLMTEAGLGSERWNTTEQFEQFLERFAHLII